MIDETCRICKARRKAVVHEHHERMAALHEGYAKRVVSLRQEHEESVMRQAEWKMEQLEVIEKLHVEHAGGGDG